MDIEETLNERGATHGNYPDQAATSQLLKSILKDTPNWAYMPSYMKESLELITVKISRMCHGDFMEPDHSKDGAGYFGLINRQLDKK